MLVFADRQIGTIGGGNVEWHALSQARKMLLALPVENAGAVVVQRYALGPSLGQCCGGEMHLAFHRADPGDFETLEQQLRGASSHVAIFGGGHVGSALARLLSELPVQVHWIDSRESVLPSTLAPWITCEHSEPAQAAVAGLASPCHVLIMSHSHAEDLEILAACLVRQRVRADLPFIGLIGSKTKWASFRARLRSRGFEEDELDRVTCPIGIQGINDKRPEVIAVSVAAQIMQICTK